MVKHHEDSIKRAAVLNRDIEFSIHKSTFAGMNGVQVWKDLNSPKDLRLFPWEEPNKQHTLDGDAANAFLKQIMT